MSVGGIGGFAPFPQPLFERPGVGPETPREQQAPDVAEQAERLAERRRLERQAAERQARQKDDAVRGDLAFQLRQRLIDPADGRPATRGSIVDIEV